jgi:DNA-binding YbaB/EbfC family protein
VNRAQRRAQGGGFGISPDLLRQAQEMQQKLLQAQQEAANAISEGTAGGGAVRAAVRGDLKIVSVTIAPEAVDPDDVEMLQDLIVAAIRDAQQRAEAKQAEMMSTLTGGLNIPGLP